MFNHLKDFDVKQELIDEIKNEINSWTKGFRYTENGQTKGGRIALIVRAHYSSIFNNIGKFDIDEFAKILNLDIVYNTNLRLKEDANPNSFKDDYNLWGILNKKERRIYVSDHLWSERGKRFTIAHELGHFFMDDKKENDVFFRDRNDAGEVKINDFAANLLTGGFEELEKQLSKYKNDFFKIANHFMVPIETISILIQEKEKWRQTSSDE